MLCRSRGCSEISSVVCQRWCVFLKGSRSPLWCVLCNQGVWLLSEILRGFWGLDVALAKEWTNIKLYVLIFLSFVLTLLIKTTDCFAKTFGWFSGITLKTILKLAELISTSLIPHWLSIYLHHLRKSFINNSPPLVYGLHL